MASFATTITLSALIGFSSSSPLSSSLTTHWGGSSSASETTTLTAATITSDSTATITTLTSNSLSPTSSWTDACTSQTTAVCTVSPCTTAETITGMLPETISDGTMSAFQDLLFLEHLESSLFTYAAENFSNWDISASLNDSKVTVEGIATQKQSHIHTLEAIVRAYDMTPIKACNYSFPVHGWDDFVFLGQRLTTVGIGALSGFAGDIAATDPSLVSSLSSMLTVKARHNAFLLLERGYFAAAQAFDTAIHMLWAQNFALQYVVPGSCPDGIALPVLPVLQVEFDPSQHGQAERRVDFSWDASQVPFVAEAGRPLMAAWVSQLAAPMYTNVTADGTGMGHTAVPKGLIGQVFVAITSRQPTDQWSLEWTTLAGPALVDLA